MSTDLEKAAYEATHRAAWAIVHSTIESIVSDIKENGWTDLGDEFHDHIHEVVDNALIYNITHHICVWGLPDCTDFDDGFDASTDLEKRIATRAYANLDQQVREVGHERFEEAFAVNRDAAEETAVES